MIWMNIGGKLTHVKHPVQIVRMPARGVISSKAIAHLRKKKGLSQLNLSRLVGVSERTVRLWESGRFRPSGSASILLKRILKVDGTAVGKNRGTQLSSPPEEILDLIKHSRNKELEAKSELELAREEKNKINNKIRKIKAKKNKWAHSAAQRRREEGPSSKNLFKYRKKKGDCV